MRFVYILVVALLPAVTQAAKLTVYNESGSDLVVDGAIQFRAGVSDLQLDVLSSGALANLNAHFVSDGNFPAFVLDGAHDAFILADLNGVQDFGVAEKSSLEIFMLGFSFVFVMGLLGTAMRWVRKIIAGGCEEGE